ncbi:ead/Ea22-like family protein [Klebsiella grimontii]|uniref:ead/Ea22-like family protein n=1 Tax=Klebsiella grimontii TaxID=2058152 RepID=UPI002246E1A7|nr:ead/Ea22-like family protein [Klebsiella grimontii]MCW9471289.1 ead/Ea22-like family protein [Klebsiella grimontii]
MTTNITELAQSLKAAAEKSGIEQWVNNRGEVNTADYEVDGGVYIDHICDCEIIGTESPRAEFIALVNPANILALVEALEKAQTKAIEQGRTSCELFDEVTALRQRIAELESRSVKLPSELELRNNEVCSVCAGNALQVIEDKLTAAGIKWEAE